MPIVQEFDLPSLQLRVSPFRSQTSTCIRQVNCDHDMIGALKKRSGYITYLGTPDNSKVNSLWNWTQNNGTQLWNYRLSGGTLYYSTQGTGAWTICGNGTFTNGTYIGHTVLEDTMIIGDGVNATRHTTNGTSFTDTTSAPIAPDFETFQGRVWAAGTASTAFFCTTGTPTDWTTDDGSVLIPGPGKLSKVFKASDRLVFCKNSNTMFKYDGYSLVDMATNLGPSSPQSFGEVENFRFYLNRLGFFGFGGNAPEIVSNPIRRQIYNDAGSAIVGTVFNNAPGVAHQYHYYCAVGTVTDDLTDETINNLVHTYDFQLNEWHNHDFGTLPTAFTTYQDTSGIDQMIFGDNNGQCYQMAGTALTDNGIAINPILEYVAHAGRPELQKKWNYIWLFFNPGCQARVQVSFADSFIKGKKKWLDLGDVSSGFKEFRFTDEARSRLMFIKTTESSKDSRFEFYGYAYSYDPIERY